MLGEAHLRRILRSYARHCNNLRTHRSLDKDAPISRPVQRIGSIKSHVILGGLHHHYGELRFSVQTPDIHHDRFHVAPPNARNTVCPDPLIINSSVFTAISKGILIACSMHAETLQRKQLYVPLPFPL